MNAKDLKQKIDDRAKVNKWLDHINETDQSCRNEVLEQCSKDPEARAFYVGLYRSECNDK